MSHTSNHNQLLNTFIYHKPNHSEYLVNKSLLAAGKKWLKMNSCLRSEASRAVVKILRTIFLPRALSSNISASRKGVYLFYNPPNNFSRHLDCSCIPCGFFRVSLCGIVEIKSDDRYQIKRQISSDIHHWIL